jgi:hypothetical protein
VLGSAPAVDTKAVCPSQTSGVGGGVVCLHNGWKGSYGYPVAGGLDQLKPSYVDVAGWQGNCGAGPVRVYAICCPIGTVNVPNNYGQYL